MVSMVILSECLEDLIKRSGYPGAFLFPALANVSPLCLLRTMEIEVFEISYRYYSQYYTAEVTKFGNLYRVSPEESAHAEMFGEYVFTEIDGKFTYTKKHPHHLEYLIAVSIALENRNK